MIDISVVVPCYNSEKNLKKVIDELIIAIEKRSKTKYEIILINDGSKDKTWEVIKELCKNKKIKGINFTKNYGQHSALMAGYRMTRGNLIVGLDDDGENDPHEIYKLIDKINEGYDYVCANYESHIKKIRSIGSFLNNEMAYHLLGKPRDVIMTSYYVVRRYVIDQTIKYNRPYPYIAGLFLQVSHNWSSVELKRKERLSGESGYSLKKLLKLWINGFTTFSVLPLRIAAVLGFIFSFMGFIWALYIIINKMVNPSIAAGYSSIIAAIAFFSGMMMILLGLIGEYVGRIYMSINNSPQYVIKEELNKE